MQKQIQKYAFGVYVEKNASPSKKITLSSDVPIVESLPTSAEKRNVAYFFVEGQEHVFLHTHFFATDLMGLSSHKKHKPLTLAQWISDIIKPSHDVRTVKSECIQSHPKKLEELCGDEASEFKLLVGGYDAAETKRVLNR